MLLTQGERGQEGPSFAGYLEGAFSGPHSTSLQLGIVGLH